MRIPAILVGLTLVCSCGPRPLPKRPVTIAAAANLTDVFESIGKVFTARTGNRAVFTYGATAQLAQQVENGAPFDVFAAADTLHIDQLVTKGKIAPQTRAIYARGQLAVWSPNVPLRELKDLAGDGVKFVAIATPGSAPYGRASIDALKASGLWTRVQPKVVYANNISMAKQFGASGNADASFTAYSLVLREKGTVLRVDPLLHAPLDQALGILADAQNLTEARQFVEIVLGPEGRRLLEQFGYRTHK